MARRAKRVMRRAWTAQDEGNLGTLEKQNASESDLKGAQAHARRFKAKSSSSWDPDRASTASKIAGWNEKKSTREPWTLGSPPRCQRYVR